MYLHIPVMYFCCCCSVYCYHAVAAAAVLLLAAAVRRRVPGDTICCCDFLHLIPVFSFSSFQHELFLCTPWQYLSHVHPRFVYTSSVITGMCGAKAGVSPPWRSCYNMHLVCMCFVINLLYTCFMYWYVFRGTCYIIGHRIVHGVEFFFLLEIIYYY